MTSSPLINIVNMLQACDWVAITTVADFSLQIHIYIHIINQAMTLVPHRSYSMCTTQVQIITDMGIKGVKLCWCSHWTLSGLIKGKLITKGKSNGVISCHMNGVQHIHRKILSARAERLNSWHTIIIHGGWLIRFTEASAVSLESEYILYIK